MARQDGDQAPEQRFAGTWWGCSAPACWNAVLEPTRELLAELEAQGRKPKGTITITHTRADGTLLEGSRKGDGVFEIVRPHRFWFGRSLPGVLFIRNSRDKQADRWTIRRAAEALRAVGWSVEIDVDEDSRRSFAQAEQDRVERAEERAERFGEYAGNAAARSEAHRGEARRIAQGIPFGQPILVGHHSQRRAERDQERIDSNMREGIAEGEKAEHYASRAAAAGSYEAFRNNPGRTLRRIEKLEADLRRVQRNLDGTGTQGWNPHNPDHAAELNRQKQELQEEVGYWRHVIAKAEADGFKVWSRDDFAKGDFARWRGTWYEVLRANAKSLTVPHIHNMGPVVTKEDNKHNGWTYTLPYNELAGRMGGEEMREKLAAAKAEDGSG
ncbi:DUF3560 domain-containing protein [Streptomyces sp. NPDC058434]|uniref:DUF3560 domain-containing protein n=1 Tax=Streptomyces sp. NPDC058434 TaxID=3346498 RepID=UPI00365DDA8F